MRSTSRFDSPRGELGRRGIRGEVGKTDPGPHWGHMRSDADGQLRQAVVRHHHCSTALSCPLCRSSERPVLPDTEEVTGPRPPVSDLRAAACGGRARPGRAATPGLPADLNAAAWRATGPRTRGGHVSPEPVAVLLAAAGAEHAAAASISWQLTLVSGTSELPFDVDFRRVGVEVPRPT